MGDQFREEMRNWLEEHAPAGVRDVSPAGFDGNWGGRRFAFPDEDHRRWLDVAAGRGLTAPTWAKEYGGAGLTAEQARIFGEEMVRLRLPLPLIGLGLAMIGPTILEYGDETQKRVHLGHICKGETRWCQGFSEPGAGSDLASLRMRAVQEGDTFVVNGQKIWTSFAHLSDWIFALVRTDTDAPKHEGITFLLIDLDSPGVTVRPIPLISGDSQFCEVFFDNVRVPAENVLGGINQGWRVAKTLLGYERKVVADSMGGRSLLGGATTKRRSNAAKGASVLGAMARQYLPTVEGRLEDNAVRLEIARVEMGARSLDLASRYSVELMKSGRAPGPENSILKVISTELNQQRAALRMNLAGPKALVWSGEGVSEEEQDLPRRWLRSRANTIEGGTTEIQLNIIAKQVLNLRSE